jgi:ABC-2 type transport system ATP-binding protein
MLRKQSSMVNPAGGPSATAQLHEQPIVAASELTKTYQNFAPVEGEQIGLLAWIRQLRRAWRLTSEPPRTVHALDSISLAIQPGEIFGLMGPNGAGKTTLIKLLCGLVEPSSGTARVAGFDVLTQRNQVKQSISYVSTTGWMGLEWPLTVEENLRLYARLFGVPKDAVDGRIRYALEAVGLAEYGTRHVYQLSSGMRQRAVIARGLLVRTPVLFLDEPTVGLDPVTARDLRALIKENLSAVQRQTIVITSHFAPELEQLCGRVGILVDGKLVATGTMSELLRIVTGRVVLDLRVTNLRPSTEDALRQAGGVAQISTIYHDAGEGRARIRAHLQPEYPVSAIVDLLFEHGVIIQWMGTSAPTLEDAFLAHTGVSLQ